MDDLIKLMTIWFCELLWCLSNLIMKPRMLSYHRGFRREIRCGKLNEVDYQQWKKHSFTITSDFGYRIYCERIEDKLQTEAEDSKQELPDNEVKKIAILSHGLGCARYSCIKYVKLYLRLGFTVVLFDHRNHGMSGRACTSMGYYERYDLKRVVDWCLYRYPGSKIITHGESMGAATVLMHLGIDQRISCVIADSAYSDLTQLLRHQLKQFYHLPCKLIPAVSCLTYLRAGFRYREVSPIRAVRNTVTPILFIHGKLDNLVPADMSREMYAAKRNNKAIFLVARARHVQSYCTKPKDYERVVEAFLKSYLDLS